MLTWKSQPGRARWNFTDDVEVVPTIVNFSPGQKRERRLYENTALVAVREERLIGLLWTRRGRKSTTLGNIGFDELSVKPGRTVIAASASLLLGTELVNMTTTAAEQAMMVMREASAIREVFNAETQRQNAESAERPDSGLALNFKCADAETGKVYGEVGDDEAFADLYQSKKLEMRLYFDRTNFSRLKVIAPNPATARGWGGTVLRDEAGFTRAALEAELQIAVDPIFRDDPSFKLIYGSNLPPDDRHPWFEMTLPSPEEMERHRTPNAAGHFYRGANRMLIHRVALADAYAAGHVLYDNRGKPMSYEEFCADPANRLQLPSNYQLIHEAGGTAVIDLVAMLSAQQRGAQQCGFFFVNSDEEFRRGLDSLRSMLARSSGPAAIGFDVATTTGETSNPSSVTVTEQRGVERMQRLVILWKERKPQVARERLESIVRLIRERPAGGPARRLVIDASNERYFAEETRDLLGSQVPIELVMSGATVEPLPAGYRDAINYKTWLGDMYSAAVNDGRYGLPSADYLKQDHRLVVKNGGRYICEPQPDGKHGDTFDSGKLAEYGLFGRECGAIYAPSGRRAQVLRERKERSVAG